MQYFQAVFVIHCAVENNSPLTVFSFSLVVETLSDISKGEARDGVNTSTANGRTIAQVAHHGTKEPIKQ